MNSDRKHRFWRYPCSSGVPGSSRGFLWVTVRVWIFSLALPLLVPTISCNCGNFLNTEAKREYQLLKVLPRRFSCNTRGVERRPRTLFRHWQKDKTHYSNASQDVWLAMWIWRGASQLQKPRNCWNCWKLLRFNWRLATPRGNETSLMLFDAERI